MMIDEDRSPNWWANTLTQILDAALPAEKRFPVDVATLAKDYSHQVFKDAPITKVKGGDLPDFEGGLFPSPSHKKPAWAILYNSSIQSKGRILYTLGHEFGHYLLHRSRYPDGIRCSQEDVLRWDSEYGQVEAEANAFAAGLLMPLNDYRKLIKQHDRPTLTEIGECAQRYGVSLTAAALRWIEYTSRRAILVVSRDGYILWARSSRSAFSSGLFIKTHGMPARAVPATSPAARDSIGLHSDEVVDHKAAWLNQPCQEIVLRSDSYDLVFSLLHFEDVEKVTEELEPRTFDTYDQFVRNDRG